ncbi:MAG: hypothetical protein ACI8WB_002505 [Phenylobacterium sp.]
MNKTHLYLIAVLFCTFTLPFSVELSAEQLSFRKTVKDGQTHFAYHFKDHAGKAQKLEFTIKNKVLFSRFRHLKAYQGNVVQRNILVALQKATAKLDPKKIRIHLTNRPNGIEIKATGEDEQIVKNTLITLNKTRDTMLAAYLKKNYYDTLTDTFGQSGIKPHHARIAKESREDLKPIAQAILNHQPKLKGRAMLEFILAFVQSIPYSTLESRRESNGAGFSPPLRLLNNNQGDCDSKVTLMGSLFNALYPRRKAVIIYMPEHALLGVQMAYRGNDKTLRLEGRTFVLVEPTGPAMMPMSQIGEQSEYFIDGQQFSYQVF